MAILEYEMTATKEQYRNGIADTIFTPGNNVGICTIPAARYDSKGLISYWKRTITGKLVYVTRGN